MGIAPPEGDAAHIGAVAAAEHPRALRRRLMVTCPETHPSLDTGFDLSSIPNLHGSQILFDCMECGQDHPWQIDDTFAD